MTVSRILLPNNATYAPHIYCDYAHDESGLPQTISDIWRRLKGGITANTNKKNISSLLSKLGVAATDFKAHKKLLPMLKKAIHPNIEIRPSSNEDESGVYFLHLDNSPFAVFKIGEKRANTELFVRKLAHKIGLEEHVVPGVVCSIACPTFSSGDTIVELWNGNSRIHVCSDQISNSKADFNAKAYADEIQDDNYGTSYPPTITGILQPFLPARIKKSPEASMNYSKMILLSLAAGLRDGKEDGIRGKHLTLVDTEECMPTRLDPLTNLDMSIAATHLPLLQDPLAQRQLPPKTLNTLGQIVEKWNQKEITHFLGNEKVEFYDAASEDLAHEKTSPGDNNGWSDGGCFIKVEATPKVTDLHHRIDVTKTDRLFTKPQIEACILRINRLRTSLESRLKSQTPTTILDIVEDVDPFYKAHKTALQRKGYDRQSPQWIIGRYSPSHSETELSPKEIRTFLENSPPNNSFFPIERKSDKADYKNN